MPQISFYPGTGYDLCPTVQSGNTPRESEPGHSHASSVQQQQGASCSDLKLSDAALPTASNEQPKNTRLQANRPPWLRDYHVLTGAILPRPIAWVSTRNEDNSNNIAPFSFFNVISVNPMCVGFSAIIARDGSEKDTARNAIRDKEFVVNFVSKTNAEQANLTAVNVPYGTDEMVLAGLTPIDSDEVRPRGIKESKIRFECKVQQDMRMGEGPGSGIFIIGEVVKVHMDAELYDNGRIRTDVLQPVGKGTGSDWIETSRRFELERPTFKPDSKS